MKKTWLLLAHVVLASWLVGCSGDGDGTELTAVGTWTVTTDWGCDGDPTAAMLYVYSDATWEIPEEHLSGGWTLNGDEFMMVGTNGYIYSATLDGDTLTGSIQGGVSSDGTRSSACWNATRFVTTQG